MHLVRRLLLTAFITVLGSTLTACDPRDEGVVKVAVIGATPRIADPSARSIGPADEVLLANVAQGLVRFDARGQIEPGLAERWIVTDDGLSYIFRLGVSEWSDGTKVTAHQVARILRRAIGRQSRSAIRDNFGAVTEVVSMTDRVLEFRLNAPRPNLLQLLAQPELAVVRNGGGTGPFAVETKRGEDGELRLVREVPEPDGEDSYNEEVWLSGRSAGDAIRAFADGKLDLLLGGSFVDLPLARAMRTARTDLQFDPVTGLFGLIPLNGEGPLANLEVRRLLSQAIDRDTLLAAFAVPDLMPRATILQGGLEGAPPVRQPEWSGTPIADRRATLLADSDRLFGAEEKPTLRIALPDGPGADLLFRRLEQDWGLLGLRLTRVKPGAAADLGLVDAVAASTSPAWFLRRFRCEVARICDTRADELLQAARESLVPQQRAALFAEAGRLMDEAQLFLPLTAPVRWSLVSGNVRGFAGNRFARHTLTGLKETPERTASE
jgi:peptide/nickel transport system substrate-binding protein